MRIVPYIKQGIRTHIEDEACEDAFLQMEFDSVHDRLGVNYRSHNMRMDEMYNFTFVFDGDEPVQASGCQILSDNVVRIFSRYYAFNDYRTDSTKILEKIDDFMELKYSLELCKDFPLVIWSRDRPAGFFKRLKRGRPDIFKDWKVYPEQIELMYKNNYQSIFYTGDINYLHSLQYEVYSQMKR